MDIYHSAACQTDCPARAGSSEIHPYLNRGFLEAAGADLSIEINNTRIREAKSRLP